MKSSIRRTSEPRLTARTARLFPSIMPAVALLAMTGCSELVNPWRDDLPRVEEVTTASVEGVRAADIEPERHTREQVAATVRPADGAIAHWPLWWEDPVVDKGSDDGQYAWTEVDYVAMPYGLGRFILNTIAWPVSAVVTPPWTVMASDGELSRQPLGYDHDAEPQPGGVEPPRDVLEVGTYHEESLPPAPDLPPASNTDA